MGKPGGRDLVRFTSVDSELGEFILRIAELHCPFLGPSLSHGLTSVVELPLEASTLDELEAEFFWKFTDCVLDFCRERMLLPEKLRPFLCRNVVYAVPQQLRVDYGKRQFPRPYWLLRRVFTRSGVMIGDFWAGETGRSAIGGELPVPPRSFMSIRSIIPAADLRFISAAPGLKEDYLAASKHFESSGCFPDPDGRLKAIPPKIRRLLCYRRLCRDTPEFESQV